jgi:hypothetical protein
MEWADKVATGIEVKLLQICLKQMCNNFPNLDTPVHRNLVNLTVSGNSYIAFASMSCKQSAIFRLSKYVAFINLHCLERLLPSQEF